MAAKSGSGKLRIIGGVLKRSVIPVADVLNLRPTSDRVRETLFNWLDADIGGARCVDVFAGTGALGLEAASRGAAQVLLNESDATARDALIQWQRNIGQSSDPLTQSAATTIRILNAEPLQLLQDHGPFDVIFLDPPYQSDWLERILPVASDSLSADGAVYVESSSQPQFPVSLEVTRSGQAGQVHYYLLRHSSTQTNL